MGTNCVDHNRYDNAGNTIKKSKGASLETWAYEHDHRNQLTKIEKQETDGGTVLLRVEYDYDVFGRRIREDQWESATGTITTKFSYDNDDIWLDLDGGDNLKMRFIRPDGIDKLAARIDSSDNVAWYHADVRQSIVRITDNSATTLNSISYDGFGNPTQTTPSNGDRFLYTGRELNIDTGLDFRRARYYESATGRWITVDPIGFDAGDSNLYRYVRNYPTVAVDPYGLEEIPLGGIPGSMRPFGESMHRAMVMPNFRPPINFSDAFPRKKSLHDIIPILPKPRAREDKRAIDPSRVAYDRALNWLTAGVAERHEDAIILKVPSLKQQIVFETVIDSDIRPGRPNLLRTRKRSVRAVAMVPISLSSKSMADYFLNDKGYLRRLNLADNVLTFALHATPGGAYAANRVLGDGNRGDAFVSFVGDLATFGAFSKAKVVRITSMTLLGGVISFRGVQLAEAVKNGQQRKIAALSGEIVLRLIAFRGGWKVAAELRVKKLQKLAALEIPNPPSGRAVLKVGEGSQTAPAKFVRELRPGEKISDLIAEGKASTWTNEAEHAVVSLTGKGKIRRVVVSGGRDGIEFVEQGGKLFFEMDGKLVQVRRVIGHTHPRATGPSQGDLDVLGILGQNKSYIIEIGGEPGGTVIRPK